MLYSVKAESEWWPCRSGSHQPARARERAIPASMGSNENDGLAVRETKEHKQPSPGGSLAPALQGEGAAADFGRRAGAGKLGDGAEAEAEAVRAQLAMAPSG